MVLFPYFPESVLSSGAFAKSIVFPAEIVGPDCGSFSDFKHVNKVSTFNNSVEMIDVIKSRFSKSKDVKTEYSDNLIEQFSWEKFGNKFISIMNDPYLKIKD
jgi:hypothetical protein